MAQVRRVATGGDEAATPPFGGRVPPFRERPGGGGRPVDLAPASAYEALTRQLVEGLAEDLDEIKGRLDGLLFMIGGAIVLDVALRLVGP